MKRFGAADGSFSGRVLRAFGISVTPAVSNADAGRQRSKAILIIGMHRSGTSALARVLSILGADLPKNVLSSGLGNELGHWEPATAVQLHNQMLADAASTTNSPINFSSSWFDGASAAAFVDRVAALVKEEYGMSRLFVMKEPRAALFVPVWAEALQKLDIEPHFVIPFRHPVEVARSLTTRQLTVFPDDVWPSARAIALWMRYVLAAERSTRGYRRSFVSFDALLADWKVEITRIASQLKIAWPREPEDSALEINRYLNAQHRHHIVSDAAASDHLPVAVASVFKSLQQAVENPNICAASFDLAAKNIDAGMELLAPYVSRLEAEVARQRDRGGRRIVYVSGAQEAVQGINRVNYLASSAKRLGHHVIELSILDPATRMDDIDNADVVILCGCGWSERTQQVVTRARAAGAKIVIDVDDLTFEPHILTPKNGELPAGDTINNIGGGNPLAAVEETVAHADLCTAASQGLIDALRRFAKPLMRLPNGYSEDDYAHAQQLTESRRRGPKDVVRVGYAGNAAALESDNSTLARVLGKYHNVNLIWFGEVTPFDRIPALRPYTGRIEQRGHVPLASLLQEIGRLDILVTASTGLPVMAANDELRFIFAALARVPTVILNSEGLATVIDEGVTGFQALSGQEAIDRISELIEDVKFRRTIGDNALHSVLWRYGPDGCDRRLATFFDNLFSTGRQAAEAFRSYIEDLRPTPFSRPPTPDYDVVFESERREYSRVAVVISLFNYEQYIEETLESVKRQTLGAIDLIVVDDCSTDGSASLAQHWIKTNQARFNQAVLLRNRTNAKLGPTRNAGFAFASAPYIMVLDADNILLPACLEHCLDALSTSDAAAVFPTLKQFGNAQNLMGVGPWRPARLACSNYIDAMAMIRKSAWATCGGYADDFRSLEDYELWMKFVERGFWAAHVPEVLALYRVHDGSMLHVHARMLDPSVEGSLRQGLARSHPWIASPRR